MSFLSRNLLKNPAKIMQPPEHVIRNHDIASVRQDHLTGDFCLTDLIGLCAIHDLSSKQTLQRTEPEQFFKLRSTKEYIDVICKQEGKTKKDVVKRGLRKGSPTWIHPYLAIDFVSWYSPTLKYLMHQWVLDGKCRVRDEGGDLFKEMNTKILEKYPKAEDKHFYCLMANKIADFCGVIGLEGRWNSASEDQLRLRSIYHKVVIDKLDTSTSFNQALKETVEYMNQTKRLITLIK